jgi:hypothetical protein
MKKGDPLKNNKQYAVEKSTTSNGEASRSSAMKEDL